MDSIRSSFKGYGKVSVEDERAFRRKTRKRYAIICTSVVILLVIIVGAVVGTRAARKSGDSGEASSSTPSVATSIKAVCNVTQYPDACFTSLSSMDGPGKWDPEELFRLSLRVAEAELQKIASLPDRLMARTNNKTIRAALDDCSLMFEDAAERINMSLTSMRPEPNGEVLAKEELNDLRTWLSAAVTDQQTCLDGLQELSGEMHDLVLTAIKNSTEFTSNTLAIGSKIIPILQKLDISIHRKLLADDFPAWVSHKDRRLLREATPKADVVVDKKGSGNFTTVREAVAAVPKKSDKRFVIYIKKGTYVENVEVDKSKWNVMLVGDGQDSTIISGKLNFVEGTPTFRTATVAAVGKGFMARGIGFYNTAGPEKHQAVALRAGSDRSVFYKCRFDAYQDTLYAHSLRQFYRDCTITGTVDFIFGNAAVVFQKCLIQPRQPSPNQANSITAQGKVDPNQNTGISIQGSQIQPLDKITAKTYLGRPWKAYSTTVIMQSTIDSVVDPAGWLPWGTAEPPITIFYAEYKNTGAGAGVANRVKWDGYKPVISDAQASKFTVESFIQGHEWLPNTGVTFAATL